MAAEQTWTGSEAEMVGESSVPQSEAEVVPDTPLPSGEESAWDVVTDKEQVDPDLAVKEEEAINKLADDLSQVVNLDEPDFSTDPQPQDPLPSNSSEPKEPDVSSDKAVEPPPSTDQPAAATDTPSPPASATPKPGQKTLGLSALQPLEALEATEGEGAQPMGPPPKPQSKAAALNKVSQRRRKFLIETGAPTSGDEQHPPKLGDFLLGAKSKAAAKRSASVSAKKRKVVRCQSHERSRSHGRNANEITGGPIRPLSPKGKRPRRSSLEDLSGLFPLRGRSHRRCLRKLRRLSPGKTGSTVSSKRPTMPCVGVGNLTPWHGSTFMWQRTSMSSLG